MVRVGSSNDLVAVLERGQTLGFVGKRDLALQIDHGRQFAASWARAVTGRSAPGDALDLGSGGGLPGLVLAVTWSATHFVLLDASAARCAFLRWAVEHLEVQGRVEVLQARAEVAGRDARWRQAFDLVTSRSFGPPAVAAECSAPFLRRGGMLLVSDPPPPAASEDVSEDVSTSLRWPDRPITELGLGAPEAIAGRFHFRALRQQSPCPDRYPRRDGVPAKRPLF